MAYESQGRCLPRGHRLDNALRGPRPDELGRAAERGQEGHNGQARWPSGQQPGSWFSPGEARARRPQTCTCQQMHVLKVLK